MLLLASASALVSVARDLASEPLRLSGGPQLFLDDHLIADMKNRTKRNYELIFPDVGVTTWPFTALVTGFEPDEPVDDALSASVTLKITGKPTLV